MDDKKLEEIIKDIKCGNALAYSYIVDRFQNLAFTIAYRITKNNEDAQEVVQDSFLKAFHNIHQYNGISKFHSWLFKIVFNTALSKIKKKKLEIISISDSDIDDYGFENSKPWDRLIQEDRKVYINKALEQLNESDGLVLSLYYLLEKNIAEISEITGWNNSAIKVRLFRARSKFLNVLNTLLKDDLKSIL